MVGGKAEKSIVDMMQGTCLPKAECTFSPSRHDVRQGKVASLLSLSMSGFQRPQVSLPTLPCNSSHIHIFIRA